MPLVVPGLMGASSKDPQTEWENKLVGKTLTDKGPSNETSFSKADLPKDSRVLEQSGFQTMDHQAQRLNVHVDEKGMVNKVSLG